MCGRGFRNKILLFLKWRQKPTRPILCYYSVVNMKKDNFANFENSYKFIIISVKKTNKQTKKQTKEKKLGLVPL